MSTHEYGPLIFLKPPATKFETPEGNSTLVGDPKRQATGLFKGVDFQVWLTVDAWITLEEEQVLVVEGVEDFDIIKEAGGITTQAKALSQPITLRSESVIEAVRNFWIAKHQNPVKAIEFRFMTTAGIGTEAGDPFGARMAGLSLWMADSERGQTGSTDKARQFLLTDSSTSEALAEALPAGVPSLMDFLRNSTPDQVYAGLIQPIKWLTNHAGVESTKEAARIRLHAYGEKMGLLPGDADRALPHLFEAVAQKACKEHRQLTREDFRLLFEEATKPTRHEQAQLQAVIAAAQRTLVTFAPEAGSVALIAEALVFKVPDLPPIWVTRDNLIGRIVSSLTSAGFAGVHGSTGKGKSTLAKLVVARMPGPWQWVNLRGMQPGQIQAVLSRVALLVATSKGTKIVLDNIDVRGPEEVRLSKKLATLTRLSISSGGLLIATAQREFPFAFRAETELPDDSFIDVPDFTKEEIELLSRQGGCPEEILKIQAALVLLQTGGHPALANACVSMRKRRGWAVPSANEMLQQPKELADERQMARQLLGELQEGEIELLHRLSLMSGIFRRDQSIAIAEIEPSIPRAGDKFDQLVGPWIESAGGDYYRLSSLLSQSGQENWSKERVMALRNGIGVAILKTGKLTLVEASEILMQSLLAQSSGLAVLLLMKLLTLPFKSRAEVSKQLWWMVAFTDDKPVFPDYPLANLMFRQVQFRVASGADHESAPRLAEMVLNETEKLDGGGGEIREFLIAGATGDIILAVDVLVPPKVLLSCWLKEVKVTTSSEQIRAFFDKAQKHGPKKLLMASQSISEVLLGFVLSRRGGPAYLVEMIRAIDELTETERQQVLDGLRRVPARLLHFMDRIWTDELDKPEQDWNTVIAAVRTAWEAGCRWKLPDLVMCCARGIAAIQDEYLNDAATALATLARAVEDAGTDGALLRAQRGTVYSRQGRHQEAYNEWFSTLGDWKTDEPESAQRSLFTFSKCGAAASRLNRWEDAASIFLKGRQIAAAVYMKTEATAFGFDAAHALWRAGKRHDSLVLFSDCLRELEKRNGKREPSGFHTLWKMAEHIIHWCSLDAGAQGQKYEVPYGGLCSEARDQEGHKIVEGRPRAPLPLIWYFLAEAEFCAGLGDQFFLELMASPDRKVYPGPRALIAYLAIRRAFKIRSFLDLPALVEELAISSTLATPGARPESVILEPGREAGVSQAAKDKIPGLACEAFSTALMHLASAGQDLFEALAEWRNSAKSAVTGFDFGSFLDEIEDILRLPIIEVGKLYQSRPSNRLRQLLSSLRLAHDPEGSLQVCFVGCITLVTDDQLYQGIFLTGDALGDLVRRVWLERLNFPAEFSLARLSVPAVQHACDDKSSGLRLAARILLAAETAVSTRLPDDMRKKLLELVGTEPEVGIAE
ncbi:MAG: hypothetical protein WCL11_05190 [Verrucomicrobiota bacterium]